MATADGSVKCDERKPNGRRKKTQSFVFLVLHFSVMLSFKLYFFAKFIRNAFFKVLDSERGGN